MLPLITAEGRVVADPELRFAPTGMAVCKFRMVCASRKKQDDGTWVDDKVLWMPVTVFRDTAEHVAESVEKGDLVTVVGRIHTHEWEDEESRQKRSRVEMTADSVAVSLQFRTVPHGAGKSERSQSRQTEDPWASGEEANRPAAYQADDAPPF